MGGQTVACGGGGGAALMGGGLLGGAGARATPGAVVGRGGGGCLAGGGGGADLWLPFCDYKDKKKKNQKSVKYKRTNFDAFLHDESDDLAPEEAYPVLT